MTELSKIEEEISNILLWFITTELKKTKFTDFLSTFLHDKGTVEYGALVKGNFYFYDGDVYGNAMMTTCFEVLKWTKTTCTITPPFTPEEGTHQTQEEWIEDIYRNVYNVDPRSHGMIDWEMDAPSRGGGGRFKICYTNPYVLVRGFVDHPMEVRRTSEDISLKKNQIDEIYDVRHLYKHYATKTICWMKSLFLHEKPFKCLPEPMFDHILIFLGLSENVYIK